MFYYFTWSILCRFPVLIVLPVFQFFILLLLMYLFYFHTFSLHSTLPRWSWE